MMNDYIYIRLVLFRFAISVAPVRPPFSLTNSNISIINQINNNSHCIKKFVPP